MKQRQCMNEIPLAQKEYTRIPTAVLFGEAFQSLRYPARLIYLYMAVIAQGKKEFTFSPSIYEHIGFSRRTMYDAVKDLVELGFITKQKKNFCENVYTLSDTWRK